MEITDLEGVEVQLPGHENNDHRISAVNVVRLRTDAGVTGYGFPRGSVDHDHLQNYVRPRLLNTDPFNIEHHLQTGVLDGAPAVEQALWDVAGKVTEQRLQSNRSTGY